MAPAEATLFPDTPCIGHSTSPRPMSPHPVAPCASPHVPLSQPGGGSVARCRSGSSRCLKPI